MTKGRLIGAAIKPELSVLDDSPAGLVLRIDDHCVSETIAIKTASYDHLRVVESTDHSTTPCREAFNREDSPKLTVLRDVEPFKRVQCLVDCAADHVYISINYRGRVPVPRNVQARHLGELPRVQVEAVNVVDHGIDAVPAGDDVDPPVLVQNHRAVEA